MKTIKKQYIIWVAREGLMVAREGVGFADGRQGGCEVAREGVRFRIFGLRVSV